VGVVDGPSHAPVEGLVTRDARNGVEGACFAWPRRVVLATHNEGKARELAALLPPEVETLTSARLGVDPPVEDSGTYVGNARLKAAYCALRTGLPSLGDDTGVELDALDGAPGVETAAWVSAHGGWDHALRAAATLVGLVPVRGEVALGSVAPVRRSSASSPSRRATLRCALVLRWPDGTECVGEGAVDGSLTWPPHGASQDGFAAIFLPDGESDAPAWSAAQPHRAAAMKKLVVALPHHGATTSSD